MAIIKQSPVARMQLRLQVGTDGSGNPILRTRSYTKVKSQTSDEDLHTIGTAMAGLQQYTLIVVKRVDESELVDDGQ